MKKKKCTQCKRTDYWESHSFIQDDEIILLCRDCYRGDTPSVVAVTKEDARAAHWNDIKTRVKTHEGELLIGKAGIQYQQRFSQKYLGRDLSSGRPADRFLVEGFQSQQKHAK